MSDIQVGVRINLAGNLTNQLDGIKKQFSGLTDATRVIGLSTLSQSLASISAPIKELTKEIKRPFIEFESAMASMRARIQGVTDDSYAEIRNLAKDLGATTIFTSTQIAQGMDKLAMAGYQAKDIISGMPDVTAFVQANKIDFATGADIATDIGTAFQYEASQLTEVLDVLTLAANSSNTNIEMLGETMKYVSADARSLGLSLQETSAMAGIIANAGIKASMAGTTLKETINSLAVPDDKAQQVLERLKIKVYNEAGEMRSIVDILRDLNDATEDLTQQQRKADIQAIFKDRGSRGILNLMSQGQDAFEEFLDNLVHSADGTVRTMQEMMSKSLAAGLLAIQSRKEALFTSITEGGREQLLGVQKLKIGFLDGLNDIAKENTVLSSRISLATQLLSDVGGAIASSGAVLTTILSGFTALNTFKGQKAVEEIARNPLGLKPGQPLPVWVVNSTAQAATARIPLQGYGANTVATTDAATKKAFPSNKFKMGNGMKFGLVSFGLNGLSLALESIAIKTSDLNEQAQKRALKDTFNRNAWGLFGSTAGAVIGSVVSPGIGTAIGAALGQGLGDWIGSKTEESKTDEGRYKQFLKEQQKAYKEKNKDIAEFEKDLWLDQEQLKPKHRNRRLKTRSLLSGLPIKAVHSDSSRLLYGIEDSLKNSFDFVANIPNPNAFEPPQYALASISEMLKKNYDYVRTVEYGLMPTDSHNKAAIENFIEDPIKEWLNLNIETPELAANQLTNWANQIINKPNLAEHFKTIITPYQNELGEMLVEVQAPFLDMMRDVLPQEYLDSKNYKSFIQGVEKNLAHLYKQKRNIDARKYIPQLAEEFNRWKYEQTQAKNKQDEEAARYQGEMLNEVRALIKVNEAMLDELKNKPSALRAGS